MGSNCTASGVPRLRLACAELAARVQCDDNDSVHVCVPEMTDVPVADSDRTTAGVRPIGSKQHAITRTLREALPALGDFGFVCVTTGPTIPCVAAAHATRPGMRLVRELARRYRIRVSDRWSTVAHVVRTGRPLVRSYITPEPNDAAVRGAVAEYHRRLAPRAALVVPIVVGGVSVGALTLCYSRAGLSYAGRKIAAAGRVAERIAKLLTSTGPDAATGLRSAARDARQGTTVRRRVAARA